MEHSLKILHALLFGRVDPWPSIVGIFSRNVAANRREFDAFAHLAISKYPPLNYGAVAIKLLH